MNRGTHIRAWSGTVAAALLAIAVAGSARAEQPGARREQAAGFESSVLAIGAAMADEMRGVSWRPGCPVAIDDLRLVKLNHWGFDGAIHQGELVVHRDVAAGVVGVFSGLFAERFPIRRIERIEHYRGDDDASMAADNTSAFNCREITGGGSWSVHSWGKAIDINPLENPYVKDAVVHPSEGRAYLDRSDVRPGMIIAGDTATEAFAAIGFRWGGDWSRLKDYQHFEVADPTSAPAPASGCREYVENGGAYPVRLCQSGPAVTSVQTQLVHHGFALAVDGFFGPETLGAVRRFQADHGLEVDGLVGPLTWGALANGATAPPWEAAPPSERETIDVTAEPDGAGGLRVTVTVGNLLDDSIEAVRYELHVAPRDDFTVELLSGTWTQRCQEGRGHQDFAPELCV